MRIRIRMVVCVDMHMYVCITRMKLRVNLHRVSYSYINEATIIRGLT